MAQVLNVKTEPSKLWFQKVRSPKGVGVGQGGGEGMTILRGLSDQAENVSGWAQPLALLAHAVDKIVAEQRPRQPPASQARALRAGPTQVPPPPAPACSPSVRNFGGPQSGGIQKPRQLIRQGPIKRETPKDPPQKNGPVNGNRASIAFRLGNKIGTVQCKGTPRGHKDSQRTSPRLRGG